MHNYIEGRDTIAGDHQQGIAQIKHITHLTRGDQRIRQALDLKERFSWQRKRQRVSIHNTLISSSMPMGKRFLYRLGKNVSFLKKVLQDVR